MRLEDEKLKEDTATVDVQNDELTKLRAAIAAEQADVDVLTEKLEE